MKTDDSYGRVCCSGLGPEARFHAALGIASIANRERLRDIGCGDAGFMRVEKCRIGEIAEVDAHRTAGRPANTGKCESANGTTIGAGH